MLKSDWIRNFLKHPIFIKATKFEFQALEGVVAVRFNFRGGSKLHKGYAFVDLDSERHFRNALAKDRTPLDGRPMFVSN